MQCFGITDFDELVFEMCKETLSQMINELKTAGSILSSSQIRRILHQLIQGILFITFVSHILWNKIFKKLINLSFSALEWLHVIGIYHKDLNTGNIFIDLEGRVKIADFGTSLNLFINNNKFGHWLIDAQVHLPWTTNVADFVPVSRFLPIRSRCSYSSCSTLHLVASLRLLGPSRIIL